MGLTQSAARRVDVLFVTRLGIHDAHQSDVGQLAGTLVVHLQGDDVVLAVGNLQRLQEVLPVVEIAEHKGRAASFRHAGQKLQRLLHVSTLRLWLEVQHLAYNI